MPRVMILLTKILPKQLLHIIYEDTKRTKSFNKFTIIFKFSPL